MSNNMRSGLRFLMVVGVVIFSNPHDSMQQTTTEVLRAATVIYRHGDRNPIKSYPGDPFKFETVFWPEGYGAMTMAGKVRMYNLGWYMRKRYPTFQRKNVVVYSSDNNRTITSAMANLAGFYGQNRSFLRHVDSFNPKGLGINVIPKKDDDFILFESQPCPKYKQLHEEYLNETQPLEKYKDALETINENTGLNFSTFSIDLVIFADTIIIQKSRDLKLPEWVQDLYEDDIFFELRDEYFINIMPTFELKRLRTGTMLKRFFDEMDLIVKQVEQLSPQKIRDNINQVDFPKITIISGHDSTIANWMIDLDIFDWEGPPYAATVFIELYEETKQNNTSFIIKVFYKNSEKEPKQMSLPGCPNPCYYSHFKKMMQPLVVTNRKEECRVSDMDEDNEISKPDDYTSVSDDSVAVAKSDSKSNACRHIYSWRLAPVAYITFSLLWFTFKIYD